MTVGCQAAREGSRHWSASGVLPVVLVFFTTRRRLFIRFRASPCIFMHAGWPRGAERGSYRRISRVSRLSPRGHRRTASIVIAVAAAAAAATRPRLRRLGNQVEPRASKQGRLRRRIGTRTEGKREKKRTRRRPYLEKEISEEHFAPRTTELLLFSRRPPFHHNDDDHHHHLIVSLSFPSFGSILHTRGLFPQPVARMDLTDEKQPVVFFSRAFSPVAFPPPILRRDEC